MTRIASVKPHPISVPLNDPVWTAHEELTSSSVIVVEVRTDDGLTGYGQIHGSPMHLSDKPGFGVEIDWDYAKRYAA